ncbi:hypothetical protein Cob_v001008 [Colletotrichum orbiculare MAFF 240422]|uniref:Uncharacterized protein n=1 Tax=Colletotrichum orbiculare (strain 104-T / ATCC 96160 / CBS 514.97 / LARS 414 / MAFF 240422) TaxID=1213857 RepID=N4W4W4_COLOR|nr:hypothetical protein Cob_v001008 [Colletotrichum orbiculare MAFF 240422]
MVFFAMFLPLSLLASAALASPILHTRNNNDDDNNNNATAIILAVAPKSASCDGVTSFPEECATAQHVAQYLPQALAKYNIYTPGEIAGVISLMALETGEFRYNRNHFPGRPGQGTRNMQMPDFNLKYALSVPELRPRAEQLAAGAADASSFSNETKDAILDLVVPDQYTWGSAPWFLATECDQDVRDGLAEGSQRGYTLYMECIGTAATEERIEYWTKAKTAFGLP